MSFNKEIKVIFDLPSVNKSWLSIYDMQSRSLIWFVYPLGIFWTLYQCLSEMPTSSNKFLIQWFSTLAIQWKELGYFKKIQILRPHLKLTISRNSKLPSKEVIPFQSIIVNTFILAMVVVFFFLKKRHPGPFLLYYFHFCTLTT